MKLDEIGFYTLSDERVQNLSHTSPLKRCELILTHRCNFNCPYCRGVKEEDQRDLIYTEAANIVTIWANMGLEAIRFSGGEPTLWNELPELVSLAKTLGIKRIAISTNGSADTKLYQYLIDCGVNDFSISLDSCCSSTGNTMAGLMVGDLNMFDIIIKNIQYVSKQVYTTTGSVITDENLNEINKIITFASGLGVADIRLITAAQLGRYLPYINPHFSILDKHPILKYRVGRINNRLPIRGIDQNDCHRCALVLDDMAVLNNKHYPCIIYMREQGDAIGTIDGNIREERLNWFKTRNTYLDPICQKNCLDVCVAFNNKYKKFHI